MSITLPTFQNWSCHGCGDCCRRHAIIITEADRQRILDQKWSSAQGAPEGERAFVHQGGQYRLAHQPDGACVFLDSNNRCRIHAKFGEAAKPLACRIYPFGFFPTGERSVGLGLRFDCPSVAGNRGRTLADQRRDIELLRGLVVPDQAEARKPPPISAREQLDWPDTLRIVRGLRRIICEPEEPAPLPLRLVHALFVAGMIRQATFEKVRGGRIDELMQTLAMAAPLETAQALQEVKAPSALGRTQFRLIVAQYAMRDTLARSGIGYRLSKALAGIKLSRGRGRTPATEWGLGRVSFDRVEALPVADDPEIDRLFERYFDIKLSAMTFCGLGCYGLNVVEGFISLALLHPVAMYLARWSAAGRGAGAVELADVERGLGIADHHHGRSPVMGMSNFRGRVRWLSEREEVGRLAAWYDRREIAAAALF